MAENKRIQWIDIARGIGIILVTLIHSSTTAIRNYDFGVNILYNFTVQSAVPAMVFLSGYAVAMSKTRYCSMTFKDFCKKKSMSLLLPYTVYAVLIYAFFEIMASLPKIGSFVKSAGYGGMGAGTFIVGLMVGNNEYSIHVWFLYALFIFEIIAFVFLKYIKNEKLLIILSVFTTLITLAFYMKILAVSLAWANGLSYLIYFVFGLLFYDRKIGRSLGIFSLIAWFAGFYVFYFVLHRGFVKDIVGMVVSLFAIMAVAYLGTIIKGAPGRYLEVLGRRSMAIYLFQQPFFGSALGTVLFAVVGVPAWIAVFSCIILSISVPLILRFIFVRYNWFRTIFAVR